MPVRWIPLVVLLQAVAIGLVAGIAAPVAWLALLAVPAAVGLLPYLPVPHGASGTPGRAPRSGPDTLPELIPAPVKPDPELGAFLDSVNHELRTPLNSILGFSDLLLQDIDGPLSDDRRENIQIIRDAGGNLLALFDDVTELVALMGRQVVRADERVDLRALVERASAAAGLPDAVVEGDDFVCRGDGARLERTLRAVSSHVQQSARGAPAPVRLRARPRDMRVRWTVPGPVPEVQHLRALFTPHGTPGGVPRRTRLDLSIARGVGELHGGGLRARAIEEGYVLELRLTRDAEPVS